MQRKVAYGTIEEQLDMMYWDQVNGTTTWKDHVSSVKSNIVNQTTADAQADFSLTSVSLKWVVRKLPAGTLFLMRRSRDYTLC